eukprot:1060221_1
MKGLGVPMLQVPIMDKGSHKSPYKYGINPHYSNNSNLSILPYRRISSWKKGRTPFKLYCSTMQQRFLNTGLKQKQFERCVERYNGEQLVENQLLSWHRSMWDVAGWHRSR